MAKVYVAYVAVFLDDASHRRLLKAFPPPDGHVEHAHHCTLAFKPKPDTLADVPFGRRVLMHVASAASDERGCAVLVTLPHGVESANKHPHVTVSTGPGTPPTYSNELIARDASPIHFGLVLHGTVGFFNGRHAVLEAPPPVVPE